MFFIDDEMRVVAPKYDKVLIYTVSADTGKFRTALCQTMQKIFCFLGRKFVRVV